MRASEITTFLDEAAQQVRARTPLACRELDPLPGPVSRASLVLDLACIFLPARSRDLLSGQGGEPGSVEEAVVKWANVRVDALVGTLLSGDVRVSAYRTDAAALTGLGPGLTPTGDDLLVGLAAMSQRLVGGGLVEARAAVAFSTALSGLPADDTTPPAHRLLQNAARGLFPSVLASVVEMIGNPNADPESLQKLTVGLASVGAHSGADLLAGALALVNGVVDGKRSR